MLLVAKATATSVKGQRTTLKTGNKTFNAVKYTPSVGRRIQF